MRPSPVWSCSIAGMCEASTPLEFGVPCLQDQEHPRHEEPGDGEREGRKQAPAPGGGQEQDKKQEQARREAEPEEILGNRGERLEHVGNKAADGSENAEGADLPTHFVRRATHGSSPVTNSSPQRSRETLRSLAKSRRSRPVRATDDRVATCTHTAGSALRADAAIGWRVLFPADRSFGGSGCGREGRGTLSCNTNSRSGGSHVFDAGCASHPPTHWSSMLPL